MEKPIRRVLVAGQDLLTWLSQPELLPARQQECEQLQEQHELALRQCKQITEVERNLETHLLKMVHVLSEGTSLPDILGTKTSQTLKTWTELLKAHKGWTIHLQAQKPSSTGMKIHNQNHYFKIL
jgi:hypothetical protein